VLHVVVCAPRYSLLFGFFLVLLRGVYVVFVTLFLLFRFTFYRCYFSDCLEERFLFFGTLEAPFVSFLLCVFAHSHSPPFPVFMRFIIPPPPFHRYPILFRSHRLHSFITHHSFYVSPPPPSSSATIPIIIIPIAIITHRIHIIRTLTRRFLPHVLFFTHVHECL